MKHINRGDIYFVQVNKHNTIGSEQCHDRPAIIVSNNVGNFHSDIVEVVYLTTKTKRDLPTHVNIYSASRPSIALCEQICTISKKRLIRYINKCSDSEMRNMNKALAISLAL
jgi:mRNA interferase MazF